MRWLKNNSLFVQKFEHATLRFLGLNHGNESWLDGFIPSSHDSRNDAKETDNPFNVSVIFIGVVKM
jgi:hypothetical protein